MPSPARCASHGEALTRAALEGGEFAFVLYGAAAAVGIFDAHLAAVLTAVVIISMALTRCACWRCAGCCPSRRRPWTVDVARPGRLRAHHRFRAVRPDRHPGHAGARHQGVHPDTDTDAIRAAAKWGVKVYYGDGTAWTCCAPPAPDRQADPGLHRRSQGRQPCGQADQVGIPLVKLVVRAYDRIHALALVKEGVDFQVRETLESARPSVKPPCARPGCRRTRPRSDGRRASARRQRFELEVAGGLFAGRSLLSAT